MDLRAVASCLILATLVTGAQAAGAEPLGRTPDGSPKIAVHYIGHEAGEPTLGVDEKGRVFYAAADFDLGGLPKIDVMRTTDSGARWDIVSPRLGDRNVHVISGDPYVYVDTSTGRAFTVDLQGYNCSLLSFTDDAGQTWITNPVACGQPVGDHQTLFAAPPVSSPTIGYPNVLYYCYQDVVSSKCTKSLDGGLSFVLVGGLSFEGFDAETGDFCGGLHGHGYGGPDGKIYIPKVHCGAVWLAISEDEGATWRRVRAAKLPAIGHEASVAADARGNIYLAFIGRDMQPYLVTSRDKGKTWNPPVRMSMPGVTETSLPTLDVGTAGNVVVGFMGSTNADGKDAVQESAETTWNGYLTYSSNGTSPRPRLRYTQVNADDDPLLRGACAQIKCGPAFDFIDVVVAPDGTIWSAMIDGCTGLCRNSLTTNDAAEGIAVQVRNVDLRT